MKNLRSLLITTTVILASCSASMPIAATGNPMGTKTGTARETQFIGLRVGGHCSIVEAAKGAGITRISTVDLERSSFLGIVRVSTCIVTGE